MTRRDIFSELTEGFDDLSAERKGRRTLRTRQAEYQPVEHAAGAQNAAPRDNLQISRGALPEPSKTSQEL
jgi:putative transcriptional regulator